MKNDKESRNDATTEMLKERGKETVTKLYEIFNECLKQEKYQNHGTEQLWLKVHTQGADQEYTHPDKEEWQRKL